MNHKILSTFDEAIADVPSGATIMFGGFGVGVARNLIIALVRQGASELTAITNRAGGGRGTSDDDIDVGQLVQARRIKKVVSTINAALKRSMESEFDRLYEAGEIESELVPQGTLAERIRAAGAGIGGFYTATGVGTEIAEGKETKFIDGREYVLELPLHADYAFVRAHRADELGNLQYDKAQRNFNPLMAMAATTTIVEVAEIVPLGSMDPSYVHTPGVYVDRIVKIPPPPEGIWDTPFEHESED